MSKEKPEVGDVWKTDSDVYHIFGICGSYCFCIIQNKRRESISLDWLKLSSDMKYLGKSKANVEELFDVAED